jgi:predicted  nucleic acid-binding Zn-ribbon protein
VFPSGSPEILKGCGNCGGKRFFYTTNPISDDQREVLQEQANQDVKGLIRDMLTRREPFTKFDSEEPDKLGRPKGEEWIRVTPSRPSQPPKSKPERPTRPAEVKPPESAPLAKPVEKDTGPGVAQMVETEVKKSVGDKVKAKLKPIRITKRKKLKPKKKVKKAKKAKPAPKAPPARPVPGQVEPDLINIIEPGVYEIDIKRLLEENPIIIQKDGTYYVHLPSIFEKMQEK